MNPDSHRCLTRITQPQPYSSGDKNADHLILVPKPLVLSVLCSFVDAEAGDVTNISSYLSGTKHLPALIHPHTSQESQVSPILLVSKVK